MRYKITPNQFCLNNNYFNFLDFKLHWILMLLTLSLTQGLGQTTYYFQPESGNPATLSNWNTVEEGGGSSPANFTGANDIFIIPSGKMAFGISAWTVTNQVTVKGTIAPQSSSNNYTAKTWLIESTGIVLLQYNAGIVIAANGTFTCSGLVRFNRSTTPPGSLTLSTGATATMLNGGVWHHQETPGGNIPTMTWQTGSTCRVTRTTSTATAIPISSLNQEFYNLEWDYNYSSAIIFEANPPTFKAGGTLTIKGTGTGNFGLANTTTARSWTIENLVIEGGTFFIAGASSVATAHQLTINGNLSVTGGTFHLNRSSTSNLPASAPVLNIKGNMNFTGGTLGNGFVNYGIINFNGTDKQAYTGTAAINATYIKVFVKDGATLFVQKNSFLAGGFNDTDAFAEFNVESGGTLIVGDANGFVNTAYDNSSTKVGAIRMNGTKSYSTSANYGYQSDVAQVTGNGLPTTVNNLTIDNSHESGVSLTKNVTVNSTLNLVNGSVLNRSSTNNITTASTTRIEGDGTLGGDVLFINNGTIAPGNSIGTITVEGDYEATESANHEFEIDGTQNDKLIVTGTATLAGSLTVTDITEEEDSTLETYTFIEGDPVEGEFENITIPDRFVVYSDENETGIFQLVLPVELISFTAREKPQGVWLQWSTASEQDSDYFQIERSSDGKTWEPLGRVVAAGQSNVVRNYEFLDKTPLFGWQYYRLLQKDWDGTSAYYGPVSLFSNVAAGSLEVYPTVFVDQLNLKMQARGQQSIQFTIRNAMGQVLEQGFLATNGQETTLETGAWPAGGYFVQIYTAQKTLKTLKIFKIQ
jgi:hypothetical protein